MYHLIQVATNQSGRGVLRLLLIQQQINMICVPAMYLQIFLFANLPIHTPQWLCMFDGIMWTIVALNRIISDAVVAVGRYGEKIFQGMPYYDSSLPYNDCPLSDYFTSIKIPCHNLSKRQSSLPFFPG